MFLTSILFHSQILVSPQFFSNLPTFLSLGSEQSASFPRWIARASARESPRPPVFWADLQGISPMKITRFIMFYHVLSCFIMFYLLNGIYLISGILWPPKKKLAPQRHPINVDIEFSSLVKLQLWGVNVCVHDVFGHSYIFRRFWKSWSWLSNLL